MGVNNPGRGVDVAVGDTRYWNVSTFSVSEEVVSVDPSDEGGQVGQISVTVKDEPITKTFMDKRLQLVDGMLGVTVGDVRGASGNGHSAMLVADSRMAQLNVDRVTPPFKGNLGDMLRQWLALCGITTNIVVDGPVEYMQVCVPGNFGNVYQRIKQLATARNIEFALVSENIVFRMRRTRVAQMHRNSQVSWSQDGSQLAQSVEGYSYTTEWAEKIAYPPGGWNEDVQVFTVDAGQTLEVEVPIDASLISVRQPTCVAFVSKNHANSSVYSVTGQDGIPIQPGQWLNGGGEVRVEIGEDTRSLKLFITGSSEAEYAPYDIAVASGPSDLYSSLRIIGEGVHFKKELHTLPGHLDPDRAPEELGASVDVEFYESYDHLHHALLWSAGRYSFPRQTINVTSKGVHQKGVSGSAAYPTIGDLDAMHPGATIEDLHGELGPTIADWNTKLYALVQDNFENQAFGNVAGARVLLDDCWYRIRSATIAPGSVSYQAEWDNVIGDAFPGTETIAEWNARWDGKTIADFNAAPVWGVNSDGIPVTHLYPEVDLYPEEDLYPY